MEHAHVQLVEAPGGSTQAASELVPAVHIDESEWMILATPGLVNGCAAGDRVHVAQDGTFEVVLRGGKVAAHIYARGDLPEPELCHFREAVTTASSARPAAVLADVVTLEALQVDRRAREVWTTAWARRTDRRVWSAKDRCSHFEIGSSTAGHAVRGARQCAAPNTGNVTRRGGDVDVSCPPERHLPRAR